MTTTICIHNIGIVENKSVVSLFVCLLFKKQVWSHYADNRVHWPWICWFICQMHLFHALQQGVSTLIILITMWPTKVAIHTYMYFAYLAKPMACEFCSPAFWIPKGKFYLVHHRGAQDWKTLEPRHFLTVRSHYVTCLKPRRRPYLEVGTRATSASLCARPHAHRVYDARY